MILKIQIKYLANMSMIKCRVKLIVNFFFLSDEI